MPINYKELQEYSNLELLARQVVEGFITGLHKSPLHGFSVEFAEHRLYNQGESTKNIDWKLYGRSEKLFVKRYEEETNLRCQLVMDFSSSMYFPTPNPKEGTLNKITFSIYCAAAIMLLLKKQRDAVGLSTFSDTITTHTPAKSSPAHHKMLLYELEKLMTQEEGRKTTSAASALHEIAENVHKRSLVVIFSDMMDSGESQDELMSALQHLKHNKHEVILFHVVDKKKEIDFEFENRPYRFIDAETGEEVKLHPNQVKSHYTTMMADMKQELKLRCGQFNIDLVEADIQEGFRQVLTPYLLKRQRLF